MDSTGVVDKISVRGGEVAPIAGLICRLIAMALAYAKPALAVKFGQEFAASGYGDTHRSLSETLDPKHDKDHDEDRDTEHNRVPCCSHS